MSTSIYNAVFYVTAAALVAAVVGLEIYRLRAGQKGRLRRFLCAGEAFGLGEGRVEVELPGGRVVEARVPGCTQCMCRFKPGDPVMLSRVGDAYVVSAR